MSAFLHALREERADLFDSGAPIYVSRAPGRLDVMGGIADYCGARVLEATIAEATLAALQPRTDSLVCIVSEIPREGRTLTAEADVRGLLATREGGYAPVRAELARLGLARWASYVLGAWPVLWREGGCRAKPRGANLLLRSTVPISVGVASSAALEMAVLTALAAALRLRIEPLRLAELGQRLENHVAGAPCGIMDQVAVTVGNEGELVAILCQPHEIEGRLALPEGIATFGVGSGVEKHTSASPYRKARIAAFMGLEILAALGAEPPGGCLANLGRAGFLRHARALPSKLRGSEFVERYGPTRDAATDVDPDAVYSVRGCSEHPVYEHERATRFRDLLTRPRPTERDLHEAGALMYASHWSYTARCGLGRREVTRIVRLARELGPARGVYGAKITGGGAGGTVAILARADARDAVEEIAARYAEETGVQPVLFAGSSPGAAETGVAVVTP